MNKCKLFFYLITILALYMNTASATTETWECDPVQVPEGYNEGLPNGGLLPVTFSYDQVKRVAQVSLSGNKKISSTVDVGVRDNSLSCVSNTLEKNDKISYTISYNVLRSQWQIGFTRHIDKNFSTFPPMTLSDCKNTTPAPSEPVPTVTTPLNRDPASQSCLAKCCSMLRTSSGDSPQ
jgi:hypothetical protein